MAVKHLMLAPSLACPASCAYCFGPHAGGPSMNLEIVQAVAEWQQALHPKNRLDITFHGGEPLVPGIDFYKAALPILQKGLKSRRVHFSMQSNLWLLTDDLCQTFKEYGVSLGTSLDGPEPITDAQRGKGYFQKTMAGIETAHRNGLSVGCICTFTSKSIVQADEIFDFFIEKELSFTIHEALPPLHSPQPNSWPLSADAHGELLVKLLDKYLGNLNKVRIGILDSLCRSISAGHGGICTFSDCLGEYLAVGPEGDIYPCQRFAGLPEYSLGNVQDKPSLEKLASTPVWQMFQQRQVQIKQQCKDCAHLKYCQGGCPYNVLAANQGQFGSDLRDPHCAAYQHVFSYIVDKAVAEVFSPENLEEVIQHPNSETGLLQQGKLLSLMKDDSHPYDKQQRARQVLSTVALAATASPDEAITRLHRLGIIKFRSWTETSLKSLYQRLSGPVTGLNNLYLHVTFACPLRCTHCYAAEGSAQNSILSIDDIIRSCREAAKLGFRHVVITGGEPLVYPQRDKLLEALSGIRQQVKPLLTVLRTSLVVPMENGLLKRLAYSTDEIAVSLDGDRETHDARRGQGSYDRTVNNLKALLALEHTSDISLATVLPARLISGAPGDSVRRLARELNIEQIRFRPVLPLGRAKDQEPNIIPEFLSGLTDSQDILSRSFNPAHSCGLGQNLYIEPDGQAYPCYAWHGQDWGLGNINQGVESIIASEKFQELRRHTVNTNHKCKGCLLRYLCRGACRAWNRNVDQTKDDIDAAPVDCASMYKRAYKLFSTSLCHVGLSNRDWLIAGLAVPKLPGENL